MSKERAIVVFTLGKTETMTGIALAMRMIISLMLLGMVKTNTNQLHVRHLIQIPIVTMMRIGFGKRVALKMHLKVLTSMQRGIDVFNCNLDLI